MYMTNKPSFYKEPKPVMVNDIEFPSIAAAARALKVGHPSLLNALNSSGMFRGMRVSYVNAKDAPITITPSVQPKSKMEIKMNTRNSQKVIVEDQTFKSMTEAAKFIGCDVSCIRWALKFNKSRKYKNLSVRFADPVKEAEVIASFDKAKEARKQRRIARKCKKLPKKYSPIYCENLGKTFKTLKEAAKFAKTSTYTMGIKTQVSGQFIDKAGNVYRRVKPMKTNKQYPNTGDTLKYNKASGYTKTKEEQPAQQTISSVQLAKNILKEKAAAYVQSDNFKMAKELMDIIEQIKE